MFNLDKIIIPIHLSMHWCLAVINLKEKRFEYYDSLLGNNDECHTVHISLFFTFSSSHYFSHSSFMVSPSPSFNLH